MEFAGLNLNIIIRKKGDKSVPLMNDGLKARGIKILNYSHLVAVFPSQNFWLRACVEQCRNFVSNLD